MTWSFNPTKGLSHALKGSGGQFEVVRLLGAAGIAAYVVCANGFVAWNMAEGRPFDVVAYCAAFPTGLGLAIAAVAGSAAWKDKGVASAKVMAQAGAAPPPVENL